MNDATFTCSLVIILQCLQSAVAAAPAEPSPNILLIITDQQFGEEIR
jgi:hypothetical protein